MNFDFNGFIIYPPKTAVAFNVFSYQIHWYGIILASSIIAGLLLSYYLIKKNISKKEALEFIDFSPVLILSGLFGARLFYVAGAFNFYKFNPKEIIMINHGGISIWGAVIFGILTLYIYLKRKKYNVFKYFDLLAVSMPLSQAIGRWGNYFNQEAYGKPADGFFKLFVENKYRLPNYENIDFYHPAFLYESILDLLLFFILFFIFKKFRFSNKKTKPRTIFCLYLISYGIIRIFTEQYRIDAISYVGNFPIAQVIAFMVILFAMVVLFIIK